MISIITPKAISETKNLVFDSCGWELSGCEIEKESADYCACRLEINDLKIIFRVAKTTSTKIGQFVTLWKRFEKNPIQPFDFSDNIDLFVVNSKTDIHFGQFVFPKRVLLEQGIISSELKEGKRAIRVYPPWDVTVSKQAQKTQKWQLNYFLEIPFDKPIDINRAQKLYKK